MAPHISDHVEEIEALAIAKYPLMFAQLDSTRIQLAFKEKKWAFEPGKDKFGWNIAIFIETRLRVGGELWKKQVRSSYGNTFQIQNHSNPIEPSGFDSKSTKNDI